MTNKKNKVARRPLDSEQYVQALMETIRGPILILDSNLRVIENNDPFSKTFKVSKEETEDKLVYELGNGQWDIPALKKLLENILPDKKVVKDYEVDHKFPDIGEKIMLINACQVDSLQLILVSFEDITVARRIENQAMDYARGLKKEVAQQTKKLSERVKELEEMNQSMIGREIKMVELKKQLEELKNKK